MPVGVADGNGFPAVLQDYRAWGDEPYTFSLEPPDERIEVVDLVNLASRGDVVGPDLCRTVLPRGFR